MDAKVAGVKIYPRQTWNFRAHAVSACIGLWHHGAMNAVCACISLWCHGPITWLLHALSSWDLKFQVCLGHTLLQLLCWMLKDHHRNLKYIECSLEVSWHFYAKPLALKSGAKTTSVFMQNSIMLSVIILNFTILSVVLFIVILNVIIQSVTFYLL